MISGPLFRGSRAAHFGLSARSFSYDVISSAIRSTLTNGVPRTGSHLWLPDPISAPNPTEVPNIRPTGRTADRHP